MRAILLVLLGLLAVRGCTSVNYKNYFFTWCLNDDACQSNLHLFSDDFWSFSNLIDQELLPEMGMTGEDMCTGEQFWKAYLRSVDVCKPNFYRDSNNKCILRAGKVEDPELEHNTGFQGLLSPVMLVVLFLVFCWLAVKELEQWKEAKRLISLKKV